MNVTNKKINAITILFLLTAILLVPSFCAKDSTVELKSKENEITNEPSISFKNPGKWLIFGYIKGTIDSRQFLVDGFGEVIDAHDVKIRSFGRTYHVGDDYEGSDYIGIKSGFGWLEGANEVNMIGFLIYAEGL